MDRGVPPAEGRSLRARREPARRARMLSGERWWAEALAGAPSHAELCASERAAGDDEGIYDRGRGRDHRLNRYCAGGLRPISWSRYKQLLNLETSRAGRQVRGSNRKNLRQISG